MAKKYSHWRYDTDSNNIVWLYFDKANSAANSLGRDVVTELDGILDTLESDDQPRGLVILSAKANGFIAGADINEFTSIENMEQARELIHRGQRIVNRVESLHFPTVALIHGFCLGGGLELALGCDYRIANNDPTTKIGLPEIRLGIHPGFGGVARLPLLIGAPAAMDLMLSGRAISARAASKLGIIDYAIPARHLHTAATNLILKPQTKPKLALWKRLTNNTLIRPLLAMYLRKQVAQKASPEHYPAPYALIDLWKQHGGNKQALLKAEEISVARLVLTNTAQNLIRVFFLQEHMKSLGDKKLFTPKHVHVIGGGVMGGDIAAWCALRGMNVTIQDRKESTLAQVIQRAAKLYKKKLKQPRLVQQTLDRLIPDKNGLGIPQADVIIEAIIEDVNAKQSLYKQIEPRMKADAILATNTSSIPLETLSECLMQPSRLVGIHFFNPVALMQLVEIVSAPNTDPEAAAKASAFTRHIDRLPLPVISSPGFMVNRILMPYLLEAVVLESEGVSAQDIDKAALDFGMPMGPIALADTVGLDICLSVAKILSQKLDIQIPERLQTMVDSGMLGKKSGKGFYTYKNGKAVKTKSRQASQVMSPDLQDRLMLRLLNEAQAVLREGVVPGEDLLDAGVIFGTGFAPFRGGPMHYIKQQGPDSILEKMRNMHKNQGDRYLPDENWLTSEN